MRAEIISVGTELLLGDIVNTNAQFLAQQLAALGYSVFYQTVVGDNAARLRNLTAEAKARSDVLIFTGGLGPTEDDLTKEVVAEAFGDTLVLDPEELERLAAFFKKRGAPMGDNNRKQAMVPQRGAKLPNPNGTAPGAYFRQGGKYAILLPGPPGEMRPMFLEQAAPILASMQDASIRSVTLRVFGIGESALEDKVFELLSSANPTAALYAKTGEVHIRITARAPTAEQADLMCDEMARLFKQILGDVVYSDNGDDLETAAVKLLCGQNATVATAESCTGGLLGQRITSVPGSSGVYGYGAITYANDAKRQMLRVSAGALRRHGAVSGQVAAEMALGAMRRAGDDYGIGITGVAGPNGGTANKPVGLVYLALAHGRDIFLKKLSINDRGRAYVREVATHNALDMLRRAVLGLEIPQAKVFKRWQEADYERITRPRRRGGRVLRMAGAALLALALLAATVLGIYYGGRGRQNSAPASAVLPSEAGHSYGSAEYTAAACTLVAKARIDNPSVIGFLALPAIGEAAIESLVGSPSTGSQKKLENMLDTAGLQGLALVAPNAASPRPGGNTLVLGPDSMTPLLKLQDTSNAAFVSTFTYYTEDSASVYQVFAAVVSDAAQPAAGGFDPEAERFYGYAGYLGYVLGAKARSIYDIPVTPSEDGSYMTLAVQDPKTPGRRFYLCGQLIVGSRQEEYVASAAKEPLMPAAWYLEQENAPKEPSAMSAYGSRLRQYLGRSFTCGALQLMCGISAADAFPMVLPPAQAPIVITPKNSNTQQPPAVPDSAAPSSENSSSALSVSQISGALEAGASNAGESQSAYSEEPQSSGQSAFSEGSAVAQSTPAESAALTEAPPKTVYIPPAAQPQRADPDTLSVTIDGSVVTAPAADILAMICQAESPAADSAVVKSVAVAAHSWILNMQGAGYTAPPVAARQPTAAVRTAVSEAAGLMLSYDGDNPAFCPWTEMAAYRTASAQAAFGAPRPYLAGADSPYEQNMAGWRVSTLIPVGEVAAMAKERFGIDPYAFGEADTWFTDVQADASGYVSSLNFCGEELSGPDIWQRLLIDSDGPLLPSAAFEVTAEGENFEFITYGRGHGCGLSLLGAAAYAREGWSYEQILEHYYPGAKLTPVEG